MKTLIVVLGDIMLDRYIEGDVTRISPEAPVPIIKVSQDYNTLGGAANVALNLSCLGVSPILIGSIAKDLNGDILKSLCEKKGIKHQLLETSKVTTCKTRVVSKNQQMLRIDREEILVQNENSVDEIIEKIDFGATKQIIISDYAKGFCDERLIQSVIQKCKEANILTLIDPKGKKWEKYKGAYLVKPNLAELEEIYNSPIKNEDEAVLVAAYKVMKEYQLKNLVVTRGAKGMTWVNENEKFQHFPAKNVDVYDVSGAGDTTLAVLSYILYFEHSMEDAIYKANLAGNYVVTKSKTYAISLSELNEISQER